MPRVTQVLFPTIVHRVKHAPARGSLEGFNTALVGKALALYEQCWRAAPAGALDGPYSLPGGWRTVANMLFFRQQLAHAQERRYAEHLVGFQRSAAFRELMAFQRSAAADYLEEHGTGAAEAEALAQDSPLFCWASVHTGGSVHPPHVHSDSAVTGTYYARRPAGSAPLSLEDPRGRSPLDLVAGLEARLRYGEGQSDAMPPFDRSVLIEPTEGEIVVFPPWLVHSVPHAVADDETLRVSFSFK